MKRSQRGPGLYIAGCGLLGALASVPFLATKNPLGFVFVLGGCICGGLIYRWVSSDWPPDPSVRARQFAYSASAMVLIPLLLVTFAGSDGPTLSYAILGLIVGSSIALGIFVSGIRRF